MGAGASRAGTLRERPMKIKKAWEAFVSWSTFLEALFLILVILMILGAGLWEYVVRHT